MWRLLTLRLPTSVPEVDTRIHQHQCYLWHLDLISTLSPEVCKTSGCFVVQPNRDMHIKKDSFYFIVDSPFSSAYSSLHKSLKIRRGFQTYCTELLSNCPYRLIWLSTLLLISRSLSSCNGIWPFGISTFYTAILHAILESRLRDLILCC